MNPNTTIQLHGIGRRKHAIAQIILKPGNGIIKINNKMGYSYFQNQVTYKQKLTIPFFALRINKKYDIFIRIKGGGLTGQIDAIMLGISRALSKLKHTNNEILKKSGLLTCDARVKERKKYGLKKARKAAQFSKR